MKKFLIFLLLVVQVQICKAQYNCFLPSVKQYFTNNMGYLRGMRIDSVTTSGTDTIYYPFRSVRGDYYSHQQSLDSNGGSWLGKQVIKQPDGSYLFDNLWGGTTIIKTQAGIGDSWIFFQDTANIHFVARVSALVEMTTANNITDSVKVIVINAYDSTNTLVPNVLNGDTILLSKTHGLLEVFDLYTFPYYRPNGNWPDYYLSIAGTGYFRLVDFHDALFTELYDFSAGDIIEHTAIIASGSLNDQTYIDSIISKTANSNYIVYTARRITKNEIHGGPSVVISYGTDTTTRTVYYKYVIDTGKMPEEWNVHHLYYYMHDSVSYCDTGYEYVVSDDFIGNESGNISVNNFEPCGEISKYKIGFGDIQTDICIDPIAFNITDRLVYSDKNNRPCGSYINLSVTNQSIPEVKVYPNPVKDELNIILPSNKQYNIQIANMMGETVFSNLIRSGTIIKTGTLPVGIYLLKVKDGGGLTWCEKISIQH